MKLRCALLWTCLPIVYASIYPTSPVQATVWTADQPMVINWTDDGRYPVLNEMGRVSISLWRDTEDYMTRLASGVDPNAKTCRVTVPGWTVNRGSTYTLRFTTTTPKNTVYSADFVVLPRNTSGVASTSGDLSTTTTTAVTSTSLRSGSLGPTGSSTTSAGSGGLPTGQANANAKKTATTNAARRLDVEKLKFRFVFVIWPVLVGIVMAS